MTWKMPAEFAPQERVWMAFPRVGNTLGDDAASADLARDTWAAVANAAAGFEPVTMVVDPSAMARPHGASRARSRSSRRRSTTTGCATSARPSSIGDDGALGAVDWTFNGWGANAWATWERDDRIAAHRRGPRRRRAPPLTARERGRRHPRRRRGHGPAHRDRAARPAPQSVREQAARRVGAAAHDRRDDASSGSRAGSHATTSRRARAATSTWWRPSPSPAAFCCTGRTTRRTPTTRSCARCARCSEQATDAAGRSLEIIELPAPETLRDEDGFVDWNYANHLVVNGGVIACGYGEPEADAAPPAILGDAYDREVVTIDARPILERGGGIHCITQQQPTAVGDDSVVERVKRAEAAGASSLPRRRGVDRRSARRARVGRAPRASTSSRPTSRASRHMTRPAYASTRWSSSTPTRSPRPRHPIGAAREGATLGPLDGIPYTAKDSFMVRGMTVGLRLARVRRPGRAPRRLLDRAAARRRLRADRADQHAADGQRRHAARAVRPGRESVQRRLPHLGVRLGLVERLGHRDGGELRRVRARRGDLVVGPCARLQQRAVRLHALARSHLGARQLAARADDGRRRPAHPHDGRPARGARRPGRRRRRHAAATSGARSRGCRSRARPRCVRTRTRRWPPTPRHRLAGKRFGIPAMYLGEDPDAGTGPRHRGLDGPAHRAAARRCSTCGRGRRPTSRRPAPRSSSSTSPS